MCNLVLGAEDSGIDVVDYAVQALGIEFDVRKLIHGGEGVTFREERTDDGYNHRVGEGVEHRVQYRVEEVRYRITTQRTCKSQQSRICFHHRTFHFRVTFQLIV